ncbi:hypothetical protein [Angustibacter aerolatus]|uniref:Uncharacterized protein n=1 Tax=Angustibacter aerolatus TaxID=1162965 RepID=A0ABQ6JHX2_9ACTN|nr:hypothetical protein [Angustibacter aerolatus]GMA87836.1 hypothetical protein GCM10025868_30860 [Angustibacter aerolatus]
MSTTSLTASTLYAAWLRAERRHVSALTAPVEPGAPPATEAALHVVDEARDAADEAREALRDHDAGLG